MSGKDLRVVDIDLRYSTALQNTNACDVNPQLGGFGIANSRIIASGDATRSVLVERMSRRDSVSIGMPPIGSTVVDAAGVALVMDWINGLVDQSISRSDSAIHMAPKVVIWSKRGQKKTSLPITG